MTAHKKAVPSHRASTRAKVAKNHPLAKWNLPQVGVCPLMPPDVRALLDLCVSKTHFQFIISISCHLQPSFLLRTPRVSGGQLDPNRPRSFSHPPLVELSLL